MPKFVIYCVAAALFLGAFPLPYGYYGLLRVIGCAAFSWCAYILFESKNTKHAWIMVVLAVLFNPFAKFHFPKEAWAVIDICASGFLLFIKNKLKQD